MKKNANKFHHIMYLWQQEKKPKPYVIVIMAIIKKRANKFHHLLYLWQQEKNEQINFITYCTYGNKKKTSK
jgi:hypothetical protein